MEEPPGVRQSLTQEGLELSVSLSDSLSNSENICSEWCIHLFDSLSAVCRLNTKRLEAYDNGSGRRLNEVHASSDVHAHLISSQRMLQLHRSPYLQAYCTVNPSSASPAT